jgi:hypothetical protein
MNSSLTILLCTGFGAAGALWLFSLIIEEFREQRGQKISFDRTPRLEKEKKERAEEIEKFREETKKGIEEGIKILSQKS